MCTVTVKIMDGSAVNKSCLNDQLNPLQTYYTSRYMLESFKNKILPKLQTTQLSAPAAKALLHVLELQDCQDTKVLEQVKNSLGNLNNEAVFTEELAQQIYYHPEVYANEEESIAVIYSIKEHMENGVYSDLIWSQKLNDLLYFSLVEFQSEAIS
ncbi:hypothetical protein CSC81_16965, partial [Tenacibaculum discolor]